MNAGFGGLIRAGIQGFNDAKNQDYLDKQHDLQLQGAQLGLDNAKFQADRSQVQAGREDAAYATQQEDAQRERDIKDAMRTMSTDGDLSQVSAVMNKYEPNQKHFISRNVDGGYDVLVEDKDGKTRKKTFKDAKEFQDSTGPYLFSLMKPLESYQHQQARQETQADKTQAQKDKLAQIDRQGEWAMKEAGARAAAKGGSKLTDEEVKIANALEAKSKSRRGQMTGLGTYDLTGISASLANYDGTIGAVLHSNGMELGAAYSKAYNAVTSMHDAAQKEAAQKFPKDQAKQAQYVQAKLEQDVNAYVSQARGADQGGTQGLQRPTSPAPGQGAETGSVGRSQPPVDFKTFQGAFLKANPKATDADAKSFYEQKYGVTLDNQ